MSETGVSTGIESFREFLREFNHPVTPQRLRIAEVLFGTHDHISAGEIIQRLKAERGAVGKATVYRTLDLLVRAGLVRAHDFGEGFQRYEPCPTRPQHDHLVCTRCGKVIEFESVGMKRTTRDIAAVHAFEPSHHKIEIYGLCEECRA